MREMSKAMATQNFLPRTVRQDLNEALDRINGQGEFRFFRTVKTFENRVMHQEVPLICQSDRRVASN